MKFFNLVLLLVLIFYSSTIMSKKSQVQSSLMKGSKGEGAFCRDTKECKSGYKCFGSSVKRCRKRN